MTRIQSPVLFGAGVAAALAFGLTACGSGGGSGGAFDLKGLPVKNNQLWRINQPLEFAFTKAVDLDTVTLNTISIREVGGAPSSGEFSYRRLVAQDGSVSFDKTTIVFQPTCPKLASYADAGLKPGGTLYEIKVLGEDDGGIVVQSLDGDDLASSHSATFTTPASSQVTQIFYDPKVGGPIPRVRDVAISGDDQDPNYTYLEIGGDPDNRVYFERNGSQLQFVDIAGAPVSNFELPLNLLSEPATAVALVIYLDQPVDPSSANISSQRVRWEYLSNDTVTPNTYTPLATAVTLVANCIETGAVVRIEPQGVLPPGTVLRSVLTPLFADLVGEASTFDINTFAIASTEVSPAVLADEIFEDFATAANDDATAAFAEPHATWGGGQLAANFSFTGTGGPLGTFDLLIPAGQVVIFNTISTQFTGGPNFVPTATQTAIGGVLDVRNLRVDTGAVLKIEGPNPALILASGKVEVLGAIVASGSDSPGVVTLNTTNIPEPGAAGQAGGGRGGIGSPLTSSSDPRGGPGSGAFNAPGGGGEGGESGWNADVAAVDARRGAGGGGGVFGSDQLLPGLSLKDQTVIGLDAEVGFDNTGGTTPGCSSNNPPLGAESGLCPPKGGSAGPGPFADSTKTNDFVGAMLVTTSGGTSLVLGELKKPWAGAGGGAGGDASFTNKQPYPATPYNPGGDEKGAGGGGGGGSVRILALGDIVFGPAGEIRCRGGTGGGGENTSFFNRVGGGSGGGSGGHVILETASQIDFSQVTATGAVALNATGGQGGAGRANLGGAKPGTSGSFETIPTNDACPPGNNIPLECAGHIDGTGGDGGPGVIQLHVNDNTPGVDILLPIGKTLADICKPTPFQIDPAVGSSRMVPSFGKLSRARSKWIPLGIGGFDLATLSFKPITFDFQGVDPLTGLVNTAGGEVAQLAPIVGPTAIDNAGVVPPFVNPTNAFELVVDATPLIGTANEVLVQNPALLRGYVIEITNGVLTERYAVAKATYSSTTGWLSLFVNSGGKNLNAVLGNRTAALIPAFFRVITSGTEDDLPTSSTITFQFEATTADVLGNPDTTAIQGPYTDITVLNDLLATPNNPLLRFVRFDVLFDIDALNAGLAPTNPRPALEFVRVPFRY